MTDKRRIKNKADSSGIRRDYRHHLYGINTPNCHSHAAPALLSKLQSRKPFLERLVKNYFPGSKDAAILDLGCGHGALMQVLAMNGFMNVRGVDVSPAQVNAARELGFKGVELGDLRNVLDHIEKSSLDVVVTFDVIEHFTKSELVDLFSKIRGTLKSSGRWIIHTPNGESPFAGRMRYGDFTHETIFTRSSLDHMLKVSGFRRTYYFEDRPVPHGLVSFGRYALWGVIRILLLLYIAVETGKLDNNAIFSQNLTAVAFL